MAKVRRPLLRVEPLEDRWVPATIRYDGSNLTISSLNLVGGSSSLTVIQQTSGAFQVKNNGANNGTYFVNNNLNIYGGNGNLTIAITLNNASPTAGSLPGNLTILTGNGNDTVTLARTATGGATGGRIGGNLTVNFGRGADFFGSDAVVGAAVDNLFIGGSVNISALPGSALLAGTPLGNGQGFIAQAHNYAEFDQLTPNSGQTTFIGSNVNVRGISEVMLGAFSPASIGGSATSAKMTIGGNVNIQLTGTSPAFINQLVSGSTTTKYNNYVVEGVQTTIGGTSNITATAGDSYILADSSIGGSMIDNLGPGTSVLDINFNVVAGTLGKPMTIGGNIIYTGGNNNNTLLFDDSLNGAPNGPNPLLVGGSVNVNFGNGNDSVQFTNLTTPGADVFINGSFNYRAGNGSNTIGAASLFNNGGLAAGTPIPFLASVLGSESFNVGNGANTVTIGTAPGGAVSVYTGNGNNSVTLDNAAVNGATPQNYFNFLVFFGNGTNTFTLGSPAGGPVIASGSAIGGNGTNTFVQNADATPITNQFFLRNF